MAFTRTYPSRTRPTPRLRRRALGALCAATALTATACGAATRTVTTSSMPAATSRSGPYLAAWPSQYWGTTWSYNPYSPDALGIASNLIYLPLAVEDYPSLTKFTPELAKSWKVSGRTLTVHLRSGVRWQDGSPVTSKDLYDTVLLDGTDGGGGWSDFSNVAAPNAREVVFTIRSGVAPALAEDSILGDVAYPASIYGRFVTAGLKADEVAYFNESATNPNAATKLPQYKAISNIFTKLVAYKAPHLIGDGPFRLGAITVEEAKLSKSPTFYAAKSVHTPGIDWWNASTTSTYSEISSGHVDFSNYYLPPPIIQALLRNPGAKVALPPAFGFAMEFNDSAYPLNDVKVRQALAYVIPRKEVSVAAYGTSREAGGSATPQPDGLPPYIQSRYLTKKQIASLNTYPRNDAKATSLLDSAGFHKSGSQWIMPTGKPFTLTFIPISTDPDDVTSFNAAAKVLDAFGIKSSVDAVPGAEQSQDMETGAFMVGQHFTSGGTDPLRIFAAELGTGNDFPSLGTYAGKRGMGYGPDEDVPGLGRVDVPTTITRESTSVAPGPEMRKLTWDWARLVDRQLPYLTYATKVYQFTYSTARYTDWPPVNAEHTGPIWNIISEDITGGLLVAVQHGYIRPRR